MGACSSRRTPRANPIPTGATIKLKWALSLKWRGPGGEGLTLGEASATSAGVQLELWVVGRGRGSGR